MRVIGRCVIDLLNLHQHSPNDSARRGGGGGGERLVKGLGYGYLFIIILISR